MPKQQNIVSVHIGDTHIGSTLGLRPRYCTRDDGDTCTATRAQMWMLSKWGELWAEARDRRKKLDARLVLVFYGDLFDGLHHRNTQLWSTNDSDWYKAADELFSPIMEEVDSAVFLRGTEAHSGPSATADEKWVRQWDNVRREPVTKAGTWWYLHIDLGGVIVEGAHHGSIGRKPNTEGNPLNDTSDAVVAQAAKAGRKAPDIYVQAHNHTYAENNPAMPLRVVALPGWQLIPGYLSRMKPYTIVANIGGMILEVVDGQYDYDVRIYKPQSRRPCKI